MVSLRPLQCVAGFGDCSCPNDSLAVLERRRLVESVVLGVVERLLQRSLVRLVLGTWRALLELLLLEVKLLVILLLDEQKRVGASVGLAGVVCRSLASLGQDLLCLFLLGLLLRGGVFAGVKCIRRNHLH